jgi:glycosyltransferase involved in cell wall biosynthesis
MKVAKLRRKLKIAVIFMPVNEITPPVARTGVAVSADLVTDEIARQLSQSHEVIAYCARGKGQRKIESFEGVQYRRVSTLLDRLLSVVLRTMQLISRVCRRAPQPLFNSDWWYRHFIGGVLADPSLHDCDIVHIMNISQFVPRIRARLPHTRIVLHMHCRWLEQFEATRIERRINVADQVLGVSNFIAEGVRRRFPALAQRCGYIYNGADVGLFSRPAGVQAEPKRLLFVGRLAPEKGIHILLDAFHIVLGEYPDAHLKLIGPEKLISLEALFGSIGSSDDPRARHLEPYFQPGAYAKLLRAKIAEFPSNSISFLNRGMTYCELVPHYHSAGIFVWPSICEEAFGLPLVEAMMSHTPVVATRGGASPEIIEAGRTGLLVEPADVQGMANAILRLLSNRDEREAMARAAFERASAVFSWDRIGVELLDLYERLVE